jgi:hypothetical protein
MIRKASGAGYLLSSSTSPVLGKGSGFDLEAPGATILAGELKGYFRYRGRLDEIAVGLIGQCLARSG